MTLALALATCGPAAPTSLAPSTSPGTATPVATASSAPATSVPSAATPSEAPDPEGKSVDWATYRSDALAITFEYPRSSTTRAALPRCVPTESDHTIFLDRLVIDGQAERLLPAGTPATANAVADVSVKNVTVESRDATTLDGRPGVVVGYRFGGLNRFGYALFVANAGHVYEFAWDAGVFECEPARGFSGPQVYGHVINSVRFLN